MINIKEHRCQEANKVVQAVAAHGRRFFYDKHNDRTARFEVDQRGRVWYVDGYTDRPIYTHYPGRWREFSQGGTMRRLVEALRDYIRTGEPISSGHFGPWSKILCDGDLWGYGFEEMAKVRHDVSKTQAVRTRAVTT